jgi:hypothetical protein
MSNYVPINMDEIKWQRNKELKAKVIAKNWNLFCKQGWFLHQRNNLVIKCLMTFALDYILKVWNINFQIQKLHV